jgi:hypothetical protein
MQFDGFLCPFMNYHRERASCLAKRLIRALLAIMCGISGIAALAPGSAAVDQTWVEIRPPLLDPPLLRHLAPLIASPAPPSKAELVECLDPAAPKAVLRRPKMGFVVPWRDWIATGGTRQYPARIWARDVLHALAA